MCVSGVGGREGWDESGFGMKVVWEGGAVWMKVVLDESGDVMKVVLDESGFGMRVVLDENFWYEKRHFHPNLDETVPNPSDIGPSSSQACHGTPNGRLLTQQVLSVRTC